MRGPAGTNGFSRGFLKNLLLSLASCRNGAAMMSLQERKHAVRSSADVAMATAARRGGARWPQAILASSSSPLSLPSRPCRSLLPAAGKVRKRCKNMARRRRCCHKTKALSSSSSEIARRLVRKRTKVLRGMIPGGELLDGTSLLREAMDYVVHLQAQVGVLRRVASALQRSGMSSSSGVLAPSAILKEEATTQDHSGETENPLQQVEELRSCPEMLATVRQDSALIREA